MPGIKRTEFSIIQSRLRVKCELFIETGTWKGDTIWEAIQSKCFNRIKSIELDSLLSAEAVQRFNEHGNVSIYSGNSNIVLPTISESVRTFYYLDAHWWSELSDATKEIKIPIWDELRYIRSRKRREIVIVDDYQAFNGKDSRTVIADWDGVTVPNILSVLDNVIYWYIDNNRLIMRTEER